MIKDITVICNNMDIEGAFKEAKENADSEMYDFDYGDFSLTLQNITLQSTGLPYNREIEYHFNFQLRTE